MLKKRYFLSFLIVLMIFPIVHNIFNYECAYNYDYDAHKIYVERMVEGRLPTVEDTREFYFPPLPYVMPVYLNKACIKFKVSYSPEFGLCDIIYQKGSLAFQYLLFFFSLVLIYKISQKISKNLIYANLNILLFSFFPANIRSFSMIRGEPYLVFFTLLLIYLTCIYIDTKKVYSYKHYLIFGIMAGLLLLSRQYGIFLLVTIFIASIYFLLKNDENFQHFKRFVFILFIGVLTSSWFFIGTYNATGTFYDYTGELNLTEFESNQNQRIEKPGLIKNYQKLLQTPYRSSGVESFQILLIDSFLDYWGWFNVTDRGSSEFGFEPNFENLKRYLQLNFLIGTSWLILSTFGFFYLLNKFRTLNIIEKYFFFIVCFSVIFSLISHFYLVYTCSGDVCLDYLKSTYLVSYLCLIPFIINYMVINLKNSSIRNYLITSSLILYPSLFTYFF